MIKIIKAIEADYPRIMQFYYDLIDAIRDSVYRPGWQKGIYPDPLDVKTQIENGCLYYGLVEDVLAAVMVVNHEFNPVYAQAHWTIPAEPEELMVIHMLAVHPDFGGQGYAKEMVRFALGLAEEAGMKAMRLDVLTGNLPAECLYPRLGFSYVETLPMFYEDVGWMDFLLYEKKIGGKE